jgi:hypothetical protein
MLSGMVSGVNSRLIVRQAVSVLHQSRHCGLGGDATALGCCTAVAEMEYAENLN